MKLKGNEQLKTLKELAKNNNFSISFLTRQISLGKLNFEKKGKSNYSTQVWIDQYKKDFTFCGFMLERLTLETKEKNVSKVLKTSTNNKSKKKNLGRIVKEKKTNIDIEEALVSKWNNEFRKINNDFKELIESTDKKKTKISNKKLKNKLTADPHNIHSAIVATLIMFLIAFYTALFAPNTADSFTKRIDAIISAPYNYINQIALNKITNKENINYQYKAPNSEQFSSFIKNNVNKISYPAGATVNVSSAEIIGRVAGVEEGVNEDEQGFFDKIKTMTLETISKMSEKQKKTSLELNDKLNNLISSAKD